MNWPARSLAAVLLFAVAACGGPEGKDDVLTASETTLSGEQPTPAAVASMRRPPRVPHPKDARGIAACDLLTPTQLADLGLRPESARPSEIPSAKICTWTDGGNNIASLMISADGIVSGLAGPYALHDTFASFEPETVAGHPAARAVLGTGASCALWVGVADDRLLTVEGNVAGRALPDPCARSRQMAEMVLSNLPPLT